MNETRLSEIATDSQRVVPTTLFGRSHHGVSLGALAGGGALIASPSGKLLGIPLSILAPSPFHDFLAPGVLLFCFVGLAPLAMIYALLKTPDWELCRAV